MTPVREQALSLRREYGHLLHPPARPGLAEVRERLEAARLRAVGVRPDQLRFDLASSTR